MQNAFFTIRREIPAYHMVAELLAIEGFEGFPCENMLNYEFGCPPRYGHIGNPNSHNPVQKIPNHGLAFDPQKIATILNQALMFGNADEFRFIYPFLSPKQISDSITTALTTSCMTILQLLENDIRNLPHDQLLKIMIPLLGCDLHANSLFFLFTLVPASIDFVNPQTGWKPIHAATFEIPSILLKCWSL